MKDRPPLALIIVCSMLAVTLLLLGGERPLSDVARAGPPAAFALPVAASPIVNWTADQLVPALAYNSQANQYLAVWEDQHYLTSSGWPSAILGVVVAANGTVSQSPSNISPPPDSINRRLAPAVAYSSNQNQYLVVWEYEYSDTDHDIKGRRVAGDLSLPGDVIDFATGGDFESQPAVTYNAATHEYLVVWIIRSGGKDYIKARRLLDDGTAQGSTIAVSADFTTAGKPAVAYDSVSQRYLVVWSGYKGDASAANIYGQRVAGNGSLTGGEIAIETWNGDQTAPRLAFNPQANEFLVVWQDTHYDLSGTIYGQRVRGDGTLRGGVTVATMPGSTRPDVAYSAAAHGYLVVWQYSNDVHRRLIWSDGTSMDSGTPVSSLTSYEGKPAIAAGQSGSFLVAWEDGRNSASAGLDIYGTVITIQNPIISGNVFVGATGIETDPLAGVAVDLYCSDNAGDPGQPLTSATTNAAGYFALEVFSVCEYYNILETDLPGYVSHSSLPGAGGVIKSANWLQYPYPLTGKVLTGNRFWDLLETPDDKVPPDNWSNFQPTGWVTSQQVQTTEQVEDPVSGLNVSTAQYAFSTDGGASWSAWSPAGCTGLAGSTTPQIVMADVPFGQDSGPVSQNWVKFSIADMAGNVGTGQSHAVMVDTIPPQNPTSLTSSSHTPNVWNSDPTVDVQWTPVSDPTGSGLGGYWYSWSGQPDDNPSYGHTTDAFVTSSPPLYSGNSYYFNLRTNDKAGNLAASALHVGPFVIGNPPAPADLTISLYRQPSTTDRTLYENAMRYFADGVYEASNGAYRPRVVTFYQNGTHASDAHVIWDQGGAGTKCWPTGHLAGYGRSGHHISFCDVTDEGEELIASDVAQQAGGYTMAHEFGHYFYGMCDEYQSNVPTSTLVYWPLSSDDPVSNSLMRQQRNAMSGTSNLGYTYTGDFSWLNFSTNLNNTQAMTNAQRRCYGASGWPTLVRQSSLDPRDGDRATMLTRVFRAELVPAAPPAGTAPSIQMPGARDLARGAITFHWIDPSASTAEMAGAAQSGYWAAVGSVDGNRVRSGQPVTIYAMAGKRAALVARATASGIATDPRGRQFSVTLADNGILPDGQANDGIYSARLTPPGGCCMPGAYVVTVRVSGGPGNGVLTQKSYLATPRVDGSQYEIPDRPVSESFAVTASVQIIVGNQTFLPVIRR